VLLYAAMGWVVVIIIGPIYKRLLLMGLLWVLIGGLCYTAGAASFFFAIYFYLLPLTVG